MRIAETALGSRMNGFHAFARLPNPGGGMARTLQPPKPAKKYARASARSRDVALRGFLNGARGAVENMNNIYCFCRISY
jgi:hypothetical protein